MKNTIIIIFIAIIGTAGAFLLKNNSSVKSVSSTESTTEGKPKTVEEGLGKAFLSPRQDFRKQIEQKNNLPKECLSFFEALQGIDFFSPSKNSKHLTYQMLPQQPDTCKGEFLPGFTAVQREYLQECLPKNKNMSEPLSDECEKAVFMLRAGVTRLAIKGKAIKDINDVGQLADLMFSELMGAINQGSAANSLPKLKEVSERMLELDPKLYPAHKMKITTNILEGLMSGNTNSEAWKRAEEAIQAALAVHPMDEILSDALIVAKTRGFDPALSKEIALKMTVDNQKNDRGWFLLAYAQWKQGDHAGSMVSLKYAINLAPNNVDYQKTLQEMSKPNANGEYFKEAFKVQFSDDDFYY